MHISTTQDPLETQQTDLLVLVLDKTQSLFDIDHPGLKERLNAVREGFASERITREFLFDPQDLGQVASVVVFSTESEKAFSLWENLKTFTARALRLAAETGRKKVTLALNGPEGVELAARAVDGAVVGTYSFDAFKKDARRRFDDLTLELWTPASDQLQARLDAARAASEGVNLARDLANSPANVLTPEELANQAARLAQAHSLELEVWGPDELAAQQCVGLLAVGMGSCHSPRMIRLALSPPEGAGPSHLVLLGKGVTFDSGGISIKPAAQMERMKADMGGAAAVLGAMSALARVGTQVKVTAVLVAAENLPGGTAQRPGDILRYPNGKSVQVENTDAEGRLILADGLIRCGSLGATHIVDIATLTGSCARALGPSFTGLMGNSRELVNAITRAGGGHGESFWKLPLPMEYKEMLKTQAADLNNTGGIYAGAITAGLFLQEFVPEKAAWAHLDIAGTFWKEKPWKYYQEGPSGVGVKTLVELAARWKDYFTRTEA
ncbi:MAG: leucyl aminopeptidase [Candidatus Eremiobacterota bacterium]